MIKNIIIAMLFIASSVFATEVNWAKDYYSGIKQATKENKPVLFIISRDTCKYCVMLDNQTLKDKKVVKMLNKDFVSIRSWINEGDFIPENLARMTPGLPGIWFLTSTGKPMSMEMGLISKEKLIIDLSIIYTEFKKQNKKGIK